MCYRGWTRFLRIFGVNMTLGAFFAFLVIACLHQQPKGGAHLRVEARSESRFVNEISHQTRTRLVAARKERRRGKGGDHLRAGWPPCWLRTVSPRMQPAAGPQSRRQSLARPVTEER